jgi:hypothetical protein
MVSHESSNRVKNDVMSFAILEPGDREHDLTTLKS